MIGFKLEQGRLYNIKGYDKPCIWLGFAEHNDDIRVGLSYRILGTTTVKELKNIVLQIVSNNLQSYWYEVAETCDEVLVKPLEGSYLFKNNLVETIIQATDKRIDINRFNTNYITSCIMDTTLNIGEQWVDYYYDKYTEFALNVLQVKHKIYKRHEETFKRVDGLRNCTYVIDKVTGCGYILKAMLYGVYILDWGSIRKSDLLDFLVELETDEDLDTDWRLIEPERYLNNTTRYEYYEIGPIFKIWTR